MPLLGVAILLVLYFIRPGMNFIGYKDMGQPQDKSKSYIENVLDARKNAIETIEKVNHASIYRAMQQYAIMNDGNFPPNTEVLAQQLGLSEKLFTLKGEGQRPALVYIPGQHERMPAANVLLYEYLPGASQGRVVRLDGRVEKLTAAQLQAALGKTTRSLRYR